nr:hypothetical protein [Rhizobium sp. ACO-34A]
MPTSVPAPARFLLDFIGDTEAPKGFGVIFGDRQIHLAAPITTMTLGDLIDAQANWSKVSWVRKNWKDSYRTASSASGRYQFMRATLIDIAKEIPALQGDVLFDAYLQNRLGYYLLLRRGYQAFVSGLITVKEFGLQLAKEWASFPVLADCQGAHRAVTRGQSFYAGDGVNKALVKPEKVEAVLAHVLKMASVPEPAPQAPQAVEPDQVAGTKAAEPPPANVDPEKLDKPLVKSKTFWQWLLTAIGAPVAAFPGIDWRVQLAIIVVIVGFAVYAIKRRADIAKVYRAIKADVSDA